MAFHEHTDSLIVVDKSEHRVCAVKDGHVTVLAGSLYGYSGHVDGNGTAARFNAPMYVTVDRSGVIFVSDTGNNAIRRIKLSEEDGKQEVIVDTLVGSIEARGYKDGSLSSAQISQPYALAVTEENALLFCDCYNHAVRLINARRTHVTTICGGPKLGVLRNPMALTLDLNQNLYMCDNFGKRIRRMPLISKCTGNKGGFV